MNRAENYRAVEKRCAVVLESLHLPTSHTEALSILEQKGFQKVEVDIIRLARELIGNATYRRGVKHSEAPHVVDCSSFTKWLYGKLGFWLPRLAIQQREYGLLVDRSELQAHDLVFTAGRRGFYHDNPNDTVGHVGIVTAEGTVIHAERGSESVAEVPLEKFAGKRFAGGRRYFPPDKDVLTLEVPATETVETADDIRYLVLKEMPTSARSQR